MVKLKDILTPSLRLLPPRPKPLVARCLSVDSRFCREVVSTGRLTEEQMRHAAARYLLGHSRSGETVFWMIDELGIVRDGRVGDSWVSVLLKADGQLPKWWHAEHCLFGLNLIPCLAGEFKCLIAIVESMESAVILSELFPKYIWMATGYLTNLNERLFEPLRGHRVICFPATDSVGETFLTWTEVALQAKQRYGVDIIVSDILEQRATPQQKAAKIDLVEFLFENERIRK